MTVSRRLCEVLGVAFFGLALLWVISLASYSAQDPVLFFSTAAGRPGNFGGRVGALLAELAFQVLGYGAYLLPAALVVVGWHYFWVRALTRRGPSWPAASCCSRPAARRWPSRSAAADRRQGVPRRRRARRGLAGLLTEQLNRSGALVLVLDRPVPVAADGHAAVVRRDSPRDRRLRAAGRQRAGRRHRRVARGAPARQAAPGSDPQAPREGHVAGDRREGGDQADAARAADGKRPSLATPAARPRPRRRPRRAPISTTTTTWPSAPAARADAAPRPSRR